MKLTTTLGAFDLPTDLVLEMSVSNPFIYTLGEQSIPFQLPPTDKNLALVGYRHRIDQHQKPIRNIPVVFQHNHIYKPCHMVVHHASNDGIDATLYLSDGDFYQQIERKHLQRLDWGTITHPEHRTTAQQVEALLTDMRTLWQHNETNEELVVCSVATKYPITEPKRTRWDEYSAATRAIYDTAGADELTPPPPKEPYPYLILNEETDISLGNPGHQQKLVGEYPRTITIDGVPISVQKGFAVTPFFKLNYVLKKIYATYGYTYVPPAQLMDKAIVLNGVLDAIYGGKLEKWQLLPDVELKPFIAEVERLYGGRFIIDESTLRVRFRTFNEVLELPATIDLTPYVVSPLDVSMPHFKSLRIVVKDGTNDTLRSDDTDASEQMTFELPSRVQTFFPFHSILDSYYQENPDSYPPEWYAYIPYRAMQVPNTQLMNSVQVVPDIDNEETEKEENPLKDMLICEYEESETHHNFTYQSRTGNVDEQVTFRIRHQTSVPFGYAIHYEQPYRLQLQQSYLSYRDFLRDSNIEVTCMVELDLVTFGRIVADMAQPLLLQGRRVWLEKIAYTIGGERDHIVQMTLRTIDPYV